MNSLSVFFKKEWLELTRTKKLYIFLGIFALLGMISPVIARYMQEIIVASMGDKVPLVVPPTTWIVSALFRGGCNLLHFLCILYE